MKIEAELMSSSERVSERSEPQHATTLVKTMDDTLVFEAKQQITLRCGKASITLYPNGKIALRGEYILSEAEGMNRIVGGQIELN
ncbi:hypothetical protein [Robbsia andropogonis]|uniref:hypothetical protein n=1 Tax=Robbsia andropogonis TaxID=28092 RepID=UPI002A6AE0B1|nr:hypothetical protein [Robbsia andropogonis]